MASNRGDGATPGVAWWKSSYSGGEGDCVEVVRLASRAVGVRDSKRALGPHLDVPVEGWRAFILGAQSHNFEPVQRR
ncbi:DUF397 domain-containing protein [Streptomyces sodiiphilus]|uniref:DUF397 domain-containing protein n=1 Tax=Streptomyces sodiiphilus TaxID=226217 RepID=UPI0031DBF01E